MGGLVYNVFLGFPFSLFLLSPLPPSFMSVMALNVNYLATFTECARG